MGLLSSKESKEPCNTSHNDNVHEGGSWTKKNNKSMFNYEFDVASRLEELASKSYKKNQLFDEYEEEEQIGGNYSELDGYTNPMDVPFPSNYNDIDLRSPYRDTGSQKQKRYLKYQKDILTMLKGGNVEDSEMDNKDVVLKDLENVYDNEGCGCAGSDNNIIYNMSGGNKERKKDNYIDEQNEKFANMILNGGKRRKIVDIELSTSANNLSTSAHAIASTSSVGYKTSENNSKSLNIMPFYSTPESGTSPLIHNNVNTNSTTSDFISETSTNMSNTSSAGSNIMNNKVSTTSDNYYKRPKGSAKRY